MDGIARGRVTFAQLLALAAVCLPVLAVLLMPFSIIDLAYLIRAGNAMLDTGTLLRTDTFTFTVAGQGWLNQQWGTEIVLALAHRAGGWAALIAVRGMLVGAIFWLEYLACRAAGGGRRAAGWLTVAAFIVCYFGLPLRANLPGLALLALTLWTVAGRDRRPGRLWLLPAVVVVWANVHGSFPLVFLLLAIAWLEDRLEPEAARRILLVGLGCAVATLANPFGVGVWAYVAGLTTNPWIREVITEWQPVWRTPAVAVPFGLSAALVTIVVVRRRTEVIWPRLLGLAVFFVLALQAVRGVTWWGLAAPVLVSHLLPERTPRRDPATLLNALTASVLVLAVAVLPLLRPSPGAALGSTAFGGRLLHAPERFTAAVASQAPPGSRIFVAQIWASWFELRLPDRPVFIDPRIELFPARVWRDYDVVSAAGEGWEAILDRWDVTVLVLSHQQQGDLIEQIAGDASWRQVAGNRDGVVLVRAPQAPYRSGTRPDPATRGP